jgi:hypothetical protein
MLALEDVDARGWSRTMLRVSVDDTLAVRDLAIYIRYDGTYEGGALPLSIHAQAPGGAWADDSLTARFGGAAGAIREARIPYRRGVVFPRKGIYTFNISAPEVRGIRAVGMIENGQGQAEKI